MNTPLNVVARVGRFVGLSGAALLTVACTTGAMTGGGWPVSGQALVDGPGDPRLAMRSHVEATRNLPKSRTGNASVYTVFGQRYRVLDSAAGYDERGLASWYGSKFHGRKTSSGELYDMHALTAAHKHLPLPTFARVTNLDNGRHVVGTVNDRGPFVSDRIIDLSYAAAWQLDMHDKGTVPVRVEAVSRHVVDASKKTAVNASEPGALLSAGDAAGKLAAATVVEPNDGAMPADRSLAQTAGTADAPRIARPGMQLQDQSSPDRPAPPLKQYIQVGAFREQPNAESLLSHIMEWVSQPAHIEHDVARSLYRVRIGPLDNGDALDQTLSSLESAGVDSYTLVTVNY